MILTVTLNPALDKIYLIPGFAVGSDCFSQGTVHAGGKGLNVSRALTRLGVPNTATGIVGGSTGGELKNILRKERLRFHFTQVEQPTRMTLSMIDRNSRKVTRVIEPGTKVSTRAVENFIKGFKKIVKPFSCVVFCGRTIPGAPDDIYAQLIRLARGHQKKTVLDTSGRPFLLGLKASPYLIKPNLEEAQGILGTRFDTRRALNGAMRALSKMGSEKVVISLGRGGAVGFDGVQGWMAVPERTKIFNTIGCGDALLAGFLYGQWRGMTFPQALRWAVAAGTANALGFVPGGVQKHGIFKILPKVKLSVMQN